MAFLRKIYIVVVFVLYSRVGNVAFQSWGVVYLPTLTNKMSPHDAQAHQVRLAFFFCDNFLPRKETKVTY